jgi:hypothetical protein
MEKKVIFDDQLIDIFKKINIPTNPISFYLNMSRIESDLSWWIRDYFYKAINEFISPVTDTVDNENNLMHTVRKWYSSFLLKLYYYTGFMKQIWENLNKFFEDIKYYDIWTYLQCAAYFDGNIKLKIIAIIEEKYDILDKIDTIKTSKDRKEILEKHKFLQQNSKKTIRLLLPEFEERFYNIKDKKLIKKIYNHLYVNATKYPISYNDSHISYNEYQKSKDYWYYNAVGICFSHIVNKYDRKNKNIKSLIDKIQLSYQKRRKIYELKKTIDKNDKFTAWKLFHEKQNKYFNSEDEFQSYLITYLINSKFNSFKKLFYWEAIKEKLSENEFAKIGGANLFYLQKIDENIADFNLLLFFKQFKDTLIWLYNSLFWSFIKPYFYYILVFKSIKLQLKDWQKFFFLLMFFSAESYEEYIILQNISKSIERIWLWNYNAEKSKIWFFLKRAWNLFKEFYSSIILLLALVFILWKAALINIIMLAIILLLISMSLLKYLFFPGRFKILRSFGLIMFTILGYVWFMTIFPKITKPEYISYVWQELNSLVSLDFTWARQNYDKMTKFVLWENYKQNEKQFVHSIWNKTKDWVKTIKENKNVQKIVKKSNNLVTSIVSNYTDEYVSLKKWEYLKKIVIKEINKEIPWIKEKYKQILAKKVVEKYINWYCSIKKDYYCRTKLENIPVWFKINVSKIRKFIK